jgi:hypothetical protein
MKSTINKLMMTKCCFCGKAFEGEGHPPAPLSNIPTDRCCDDCYKNMVEPMQMLLARFEMKGTINETNN